jgi:hypothetical protein
VRHINPPFSPDMPHDVTKIQGCQRSFLRHIIPTGGDIFEA